MTLGRPAQEKRIAAELTSYGLYVGEPYTIGEGGRAYLCLVRGLLVFLATLGTIGGLTASFGLSFNPVAVGTGLLLISVMVAFTYYNKVTFYVGYILMFMIFLVLYVVAYIQINSGFQAFLNEIYKAYSDFFNLPSTRETTEYITNRSITVPAAMLFTGAGFAILLNISISAYMDLFSTFLLTFLPMQLAFYIDIIPPVPYLVMLVTVYITVEVLSRSGRFRLPYRYKKGQQYQTLAKKKSVRHEYLASAGGMLQMAMGAMLISAVLMLILSSVFGTRFNTRFVSNKVKDSTDEYVDALAQGGIASLFNRYQATGGISHGRLGGISSVAPDYETDIIVRTIPVSTEAGGRMSSIYLKAYTGVWYENNQFSMILHGANGEASGSIPADDYIPVGANYMDSDGTAYLKMWLMNTDADNTYDYRPYYTLYSSSGRNEKASGISHSVKRYAEVTLDAAAMEKVDRDKLTEWVNEKSAKGDNNSFYELIYTPYAESTYYEPNPTITEDYETYVYDNYLGISDELTDVVHAVAAEAGLDSISVSPQDISPTDSSMQDDREYMAKQMTRLKIAAALKQFFAEEYSYSMLPGATPVGRDTVEYFLTELKRGYCVHFAASSALILRSMGIPTRYIEGYVINPTDMIEGEAMYGAASDWVYGEYTASAQDKVAVVDAEIPDANAHAWIEIYIDGYGWIPYEMTPPSDAEDIQYNGLADFFAGLFSRTMRGTEDNDTGVMDSDIDVGTLGSKLAGGRLSQALSSVDFLLLPLLIVTAVIIGVIVLYRLIRYMVFRVRIRRLKKSGDYNELLLIRYRSLLKIMRKKGLIDVSYPTVSEVCHKLSGLTENEDRISVLEKTISKAAYARGQIMYDEYMAALDIIKDILNS